MAAPTKWMPTKGPAGYSHRNVHGLRAAGTEVRGPSSRSGNRRPGRNQRRGEYPDQEGRRGTDPQIRIAERGAPPRQDSDLHAEPIVGDNGNGMHMGVFTDDLIDAYIELKMKEVTRLRMTTHPIEVEM